MIVALAGRRIDAENAEVKRFPLSAVSSVKEKLKKLFKEQKVSHLVSSGACGADLIAHEAAFEMGIDRTVILPFDPPIFRRTSVTDRPGEWGKIYDRLIADVMKSNHLINLKYEEGDKAAYEKTNVEILKKGEELSKDATKSDVMVLIVWEGKPRGKGDSTYGLLQEGQRRSLRTGEINTLSD
jgi:hypothetical protein